MELVGTAPHISRLSIAVLQIKIHAPRQHIKSLMIASGDSMVSFDEVSKNDFEPRTDKIELVPTTYEKNDKGIFKVNWKENKDGEMERVLTVLSYTPFNITKQFENPDTKEVFFEISYGDKKINLHGGDISNKKGMVFLAGHGVNTVESNAKELCKYIMEMRNLNHIPQSLIYDRMGWKENGEFVLGKKRFNIDGEYPVSLTISSKQIDAVGQKGNSKGWVKAVEGLMAYKAQRFKMYVASAAPLLKIIDEPNICLNDFGDTSTGKTITTLCSMSIYGDPYDMLFSGDSTKVGMERMVTLFCDMPINLDDAQNIEKKQLNDIIYMLVNGVGKLRGAKEGGTQEVLSWRTAGLFTSEIPLLTEDAKGGLGARLMEVSRGLGKQDDAAVIKFEENIKNNYGVFAPLLIKYIMGHVDEIKQIHLDSKKKLENERGKYIFDNNTSGIAGRLANTYATVLTAAKIFESIYKDIGGDHKNPEDIVLEVFKNNVQKQGADTYMNRGLGYILSWVAANRTSFLIDGMRDTSDDGQDRRYKILGDITPTHYYFIPSEIKHELDRVKFSLERLVDDFKEAGFIETDKGKNQKTHRIEGSPVKTYALIRKKCDINPPDDEKKVIK